MKHLLLICLLLALLACEKDVKSLKDGSYMGSFNYGTQQLWVSFGIKNGTFVEYASGGVMNQKFPLYCLTKGSYKINDGIINFDNIQIAQPPNKTVAECNQDYLLMGSYNIEEVTDSIISFSRNSNLGKMEYKLKLYYTE
ncbi:MAG: hypothetical protein IPJ16_02330 [Bacteroidales bacterium]|nr:hypothetical protein [Bacteroidales bacterium]